MTEKKEQQYKKKNDKSQLFWYKHWKYELMRIWLQIVEWK